MFSHETRSSIVVDDELQGLVEEAVLAIAVPVLVRALFESNRGSIVKTNDKGRRLNCFQGGFVYWASLDEVVACLERVSQFKSAKIWAGFDVRMSTHHDVVK